MINKFMSSIAKEVEKAGKNKEQIDLINFIQHRSYEKIEQLIENKPQVFLNCGEYNALAHACDIGCGTLPETIVKSFLKTHKEQLSEPLNFIDKALIYFIIMDEDKVNDIKRILDAGYDPQRVIIGKENAGMTLVDFVILNGRSNIADYLVRYYLRDNPQKWMKSDQYYQQIISACPEYQFKSEDYKNVREFLIRAFTDEEDYNSVSPRKKRLIEKEKKTIQW